MKKRKQFIQLLFIAGFLFFTAITACNKTDDPGGDGQSAGKLKDADGNLYKTVKIGTQVWMAENLKTTKYNDGTDIANITSLTEWRDLSKGAYCNNDNLESNAVIYGRLYNWYTIKTGKLAPSGWHVPSDVDWNILESYLIDNGYNYDGSKRENKFAKSLASTTGWALSDYIATPGNNPESNNSTGFSALPGGRRWSDAEFVGFGKSGYWWTSTEGLSGGVYTRILSYQYFYLQRDYDDKKSGYSVRLVRDN